VTDGREFVHYEDPFQTPAGSRDPAKRFRGALAKGVTIWTAGREKNAVGLTVSSMMVAEGDPSHVLGLINDTTDLYESIIATERFVIHVALATETNLAEIFAGSRPAPGGAFAALDTSDSEWGPVIASLPTRAYCTFVHETEPGFQKLIQGRIDEIDIGEPEEPSIHYRGHYRRLDSS
jgi:flavin reductase (DIM6/NTAB) family NADH-FMN oxidoreductase RutF